MKMNKHLFCQITLTMVMIIMVTIASTEFQSLSATERANHLNYFGVGARAIGLNHAYTASCNDYTAPFWNPATMDFFTTVKIGAMRNKMSLNREINYVACAFPTEKFGAFALSWAGFAIKDIEARTSNTQEPDSYFNSNDNIFFLSYAYRLMSSFSIGGNIKVFDFGLHQTRANGVGFDLAVFFIPYERLRLGFMIQDFGSQLKWQSGIHEKFLPSYRLGASCELFKNFTLSCDARQIGDEKPAIAVATEFLTMQIVRVRCGFSDQRFAGGVGFTLPIRGFFLNFNYAIATDRFDAGLSDILDLSIVF